MSLGATKAWTICTKRVGVWILRPTLVCFAVASEIILSPSAMFELSLVSVVLGVLPRQCEGTREYVCKPPSFPLARETSGVRECGATKGVNLMLCGQILTNFNRGRLCLCIRCRFNSRPVRVLSEITNGFYLFLRDPSNDLSSLRIRRFRLRFTLSRCTCFRLALEVCRFNSVKGDRFYLAFYQYFHDSAAPYDDLLWAVVRGGQRRCNCDSPQKYM